MNTFRAAALFLCVVPLAPSLADEEAELSKPGPGRDVVRPMAPDWCKDIEIEGWLKGPDRAINSTERNINSNGFGETSLSLLAQLACVKPNDAAVQARVARWRQQYINLVGITEAEDRAAMKFRPEKELGEQRAAWCGPLKEGREEAGPDVRELGNAFAAATGCEPGGALGFTSSDPVANLGWWLDRGADTDSEVVRALYVARCLRVTLGQQVDLDPKREEVMAAYALCGPDARRLDRARLDKELADPARGWTPFARSKAIETWSLAKMTADRLTASMKAKAAKDDAFQKLLFDAPEQAWTEWEKAYAANKEGMDAARAYEKVFYGPSKKARLGCGEKLRKNWYAYMKSKGAKTVEAARAAARDPIGGAMLEALALCDATEGRLKIAQTEVQLLEGETNDRPAPRRGPRLAVYAATMAALGEILADREKFPVKGFFPRVGASQIKELIDGAKEIYTNQINYDEDAKGTVLSTKKVGDMVQVTFKPVTTMVLNWQCTVSNRISNITADGRVEYFTDCSVGKPAKLPVTKKETPVAVPAVVADGIVPGATVTISINRSNRSDQMRDGLPREVWVGDKLVQFYGAPL